MKYFIFIALFITSTLTGCATTSPTNTQVVQVPVVAKCTPKTNITPIVEYPFSKATKEMSLYQKLQLALAERDVVKGQNIELKAALAECTK